jgi:protocatechuate 3,4-dioxygenase beta subunit
MKFTRCTRQKLVSFIILLYGPVLLFSQTPSDTLKRLEEIQQELSGGGVSAAAVLTDEKWMDLHANTSFREMIKRYAPADSLNIISENEPGTHIIVIVNIRDRENRPLKNQLVYFYHTDHWGWYAYHGTHVNGIEGDRRHARLFGFIKTDDQGRIVLRTIKPTGYPGSELPAHIHFEVPLENGNGVITELLFDDDPRLFGPVRQRMLGEGAVISKAMRTNEGALIYSYTLNTR